MPTRTPTRTPPRPPRGANPSTGSGQAPVLPFYWLSLSTTDGEFSSIQLAAPAAQATATPTPPLSVAKTITYTYDAVGNRLTQNDNGALTNYTYDIANRLTNVNAQVYTWDNNGNLLNDGTSAYTYDQANRIKTLTQGTNNYAFAYNGLSDRISQTVNSVLTRYALDPAAGLTQVLADGTSTYLYGAGRIAQQQTNMQYFGADGLGSVRQLYNSSGQIIANHRYDPFGNTISQSGVGASNYGFTGEWTDATGLEYLRARYYAPTQGRFVTRDVWEGDYQRPLSLNGWNYVNANPVILTDPSGRCPWCVIIILAALGLQFCPVLPQTLPPPPPGTVPAIGTRPPTATGVPPTGTLPPTATASAGIAYITIDDGPGGFTSQVLIVLGRYRVKATFFVVGNRIIGTWRNEVMRMKSEGHAIGIHSWDHPADWEGLSREKQEEQIRMTQDILKSVIGQTSNLFRAPGGAATTANISGLYNYNWTVDSNDWRAPQASNAQAVANNVLSNNLGSRPIILIHSIHEVDPPALDLIIVGLRARGYGFGVLPRPGDGPGAGPIQNP